MKRIRYALVLLLALWPAIALAQTASERGPIRHVIIVSVDGLMPATYVSPDAYGLKVPTLRDMVKNGAWSSGVRAVFPTITYPAHTSIATGTNPGTHGIVSNVAWDPLGKNNRGYRWYAEDIRVSTLWDAARLNGLRTGLIWWPVTVGARGDVVVPEMWRAGSEDDIKLVRALSTPGILDNVAKRFPDFRAGFTPPPVKDESLTDIAVHLVETLQPHLLMIHLPRVDSEQHIHGPFSGPASAAVENADRQIARLISAAEQVGIWNETVLLVVSDHGFTTISQSVRPGLLLAQKGLVQLGPRNRVIDWKAVVAPNGGHAYVYLKDAKDSETGKTLLEIFLPLAGKPGSGIRQVYTQKEIFQKGGDPSAYLALEGAEGFEFVAGYAGAHISPTMRAATHGYDPERPEMQASFLACGPAIAPGKIPGVRQIDIAPTVANWLGLKMTKTEGASLPIRLRSGAEKKSGC